MADWEDRYIGRWFDGNGTEIEIAKLRTHHFSVSFFRDGQPVRRPWMNDEPSIEMPARYIYDPLEGDDFVVELAGPDASYSLNLHYEESDFFRPDGGEILSTAVSGPAEYDLGFLKEFSSRFLCQDHLHRVQSGSEEQ